jgi:hypothetical protein
MALTGRDDRESFKYVVIEHGHKDAIASRHVNIVSLTINLDSDADVFLQSKKALISFNYPFDRKPD